MSPSNLDIPASGSSVKVHIIDTTTVIRCPSAHFVAPEIGGLSTLTCNAFAFLIENQRTGERLLFDLGLRKDWENLAKPLYDRLRASFSCEARENVSEILVKNGIDLDTIKAIIWSHSHFDHIGDPSTFPESTSLIVGPGIPAAKLPPYPENPSGVLLESDIRGRDLIEIAPTQFATNIGGFGAYDFFGDGSFYLLDVPGHSIGHMCGLARTTVGSGEDKNDDTFILMGADTCHHMGQLRPSSQLPLPENISPNPYDPVTMTVTPCPGEIFESLHPEPENYRTKQFYHIHVREDGSSIADDPKEAENSILNLQQFDAANNVLVVCAHDTSLCDVIETLPAQANEWRSSGWKEKGRWRFLRDWKVKGNTQR